MIEAVFFDLDGTLMDTSKDLGAALNAVRRDKGLAELSDSVMRKEVSNGANALVQLGFGGNLNENEHQQYRQALLDHYPANIAQYTFAFEGITTLIEQLTAANIAWGIVTNKPALYTTELMRHFDFASAPAVTICPDNLKASKPDPEGLLLACEHTQSKPSHCIYIGDHKRDIDAGKQAGMTTIAVGYGFTETDTCHQQWQADYAVSSALDIWPIVAALHH